MTQLLCKWFVPNRNDVTSPAVRTRYGQLTGIVGILVNLLLFAGKFAVGILFSSVAIIADAFNNLSDAGSSLISFVTFRISAKPADRDHPFGHARIEYAASLIVSCIIMVIGFELFTDSVSAIRTPNDTAFDALTYTVLAVAILAKVWLFVFYRTIGRKISSSVLVATATDSLSDVLSTGAVLAATVIVSLTGFTRLDGIVGIAVALLIFWAGIKILIENVNSLLGGAPASDVVDGIREVVSHYPAALGIHDLLVHSYGPGHTIASLHVEVDGSADLFELHDVIDNIERQIRDTLKIECTIHMDPIVVGDPIVEQLRERVRTLALGVDERVNIHDFRFVSGKTHSNLIFDVAVPFECPLSDDEVKEKIAALVKEIDPDYFSVITVDRQ